MRRTFYFVILSLFLTSCAFYNAKTYVGFSREYINSWKNGAASATYSVFSECKRFDNGDKGMFECLYSKGYRFKPAVGFCLFSNSCQVESLYTK